MICGPAAAGTTGILSTQAGFARAAYSNGQRRNVTAAKAGRRIQRGTSMNNQVELKIEGMHCDGCVRRVTALLKKVDGAVVEEVVVGAAKVSLNPETATHADLVRAVESGGFTVSG